MVSMSGVVVAAQYLCQASLRRANIFVPAKYLAGAVALKAMKHNTATVLLTSCRDGSGRQAK